MKNKTLLIITILFLSIGFATVSTTLFLNGTINVGTNEDDFDVYFSNAIIDEIEDLSLISNDKKTINFETKDLIKVGDKSILEYEVTNASTQYDANVSVTCTPNETGTYKITNTLDKEVIEARSVANGAVTVELKKNVLEEQKINFTCTITASALERETSNDVALPTDDTYVLEGTYMDETGKAIPNVNLVVYSDTPHYTTTDASGNLLISNLERGSHEIYQVNDTLENIKNMSKEEIINKAITKANFYTSSKNITFENNNSISSTILPNKQYCSSIEGKVYEFDYTGGEQEFTTICDGEYKLETWGAQGGSGYTNSSGIGGYGAYASGIINLTNAKLIYINVGGQGTTSISQIVSYNGGFNGGAPSKFWQAKNTYNGSGGGATHIATKSGLLSNFSNNHSTILIVAGAGGGGASNGKDHSLGGHAGGIIGGQGSISYNKDGAYGLGGSQTSGGNSVVFSYDQPGQGSFGKGGIPSFVGGAGGGAGFFGGGGASVWMGAGGGSSYIGNPLLTNKIMYCYNCAKSTEESTRTESTNLVSPQPETNKAKQGNGYAKITYLGNNN